MGDLAATIGALPGQRLEAICESPLVDRILGTLVIDQQEKVSEALAFGGTEGVQRRSTVASATMWRQFEAYQGDRVDLKALVPHVAKSGPVELLKHGPRSVSLSNFGSYFAQPKRLSNLAALLPSSAAETGCRMCARAESRSVASSNRSRVESRYTGTNHVMPPSGRSALVSFARADLNSDVQR